MSASDKKLTILTLGVILLVSLGLHLYRIDYPNQPVFDETYFATQSADYINHIPFVDLHPPLGKLIYAGVLAARGKLLGDAQFIKVDWNENIKGTEAVYDPTRTYGNFPYVALRTTSALVGVLLVLMFYFFLRSLGIPNVGAVLGASLVALESAMLIETRLILLNGMYILFGFTALTFYFKKKPWPFAAGVLLGLALGVKMVAIVFIGPLLVYRYLMSRERETGKLYRFSLLKIFGTTLMVYIAIFSLTNIYFSPQEQFQALSSLHLASPDVAASMNDLGSLRSRAVLFLIEETVSISNYLSGPLSHPASSPWYFWPAAQIPMSYFIYGEREIRLVGNPAVWFAGTFAVVLALVIAHRFLKRKKNARYGTRQKTVFWALLGGYITSLLPFFTIVRRSTYLYHYFPALLFSIGLLVWFLCDKFRFDNFSNLTKRQGVVLGAIAIFAVSGFVWSAKFVYGL